MKKPRFSWQFWATAGVVGGAVVMASRLMKRTPDPDELERARRSYVNKVGRIVDGQIVELIEVAAPPATDEDTGRARSKPGEGPADTRRRLLGYTYAISGVSYETAQDITGLEERACLEKLAAGQSASVKYDPANPSNSILIADDWSGLH